MSSRVTEVFLYTFSLAKKKRQERELSYQCNMNIRDEKAFYAISYIYYIFVFSTSEIHFINEMIPEKKKKSYLLVMK